MRNLYEYAVLGQPNKIRQNGLLNIKKALKALFILGLLVYSLAGFVLFLFLKAVTDFCQLL